MANDTLTGNPTRAARQFVTVDGGDPAAGCAALSTDVIAAVDGALTDFLAAEVAALGDLDPALADFARTTSQFVLAGGKRLRPAFGYWGWRGLVGPDQPVDAVLPALAALELMHSFALVHDDVMDASETRRGRPTAHRVFAAQHAAAGRRGDRDHFGEAAAVLAGDLCLIWADRLLATARISAGTVLAARRCYDQMRAEAVAGQYLDILGEADPGGWSVDRALRVARHKTASYTVQRPLHFGAALAERTACCGGACTGVGHAAVTAAYDRYGTAVGEAFQLCDDLLGVYGDPAVTGKPAGDDLRTGKPTALLMLARQLATPAQRAELDRVRAGAVTPADGPGTLTAAEIAALADVVADTGAVDRIEAMIADRVAAALDALAVAPIDETARVALTGLAVAAAHRKA